ncbi:MAG TPA: MBL fold metallo-hydrolase, partial [Gammaproteobacteria bacterium]|nr:MBL fold metallo-hydrolase [Gammaproteobacteria bacterium]
LTDDATPGFLILSGGGGNIVVLATSDGQIVVDSGNARSSGDVVATLRPLGKVAALVNTHWHKDQTGANEALGRAGATIVAHEKTRQRLSAGWYVPAEDRYEEALPPAGRPTKAFFETGAMQIGDKRVEFGYLIEAHTDGDLYVRFPDVNIIAVGDVVSPELDPVLDWFGGGWLGGRVDALSVLLELGDASTRYVPSFGPVLGRAEVQAEHDLMLTIFDRMVVNLRLGQTPADMLKAGVLDGLPRTFADPGKFLYDAHKGLWAHHNKLMNDIV